MPDVIIFILYFELQLEKLLYLFDSFVSAINAFSWIWDLFVVSNLYYLRCFCLHAKGLDDNVNLMCNIYTRWKYIATNFLRTFWNMFRESVQVLMLLKLERKLRLILIPITCRFPSRSQKHIIWSISLKWLWEGTLNFNGKILTDYCGGALSDPKR